MENHMGKRNAGQQSVMSCWVFSLVFHLRPYEGNSSARM